MEPTVKSRRALTGEEKEARRIKRILIRRALLRERLREGREELWRMLKMKPPAK